MKTRIAITLALAAAAAAPLHAQPSAPFTVVEAGRSFATLQEAVNRIGSGSGTIRIAPGRYGDCAVQDAGRIAYVAERRGRAIFDGGACEGKGTLVLKGKGARVEGLVFTRVRVPDGNGAGIRLQEGDLDVSWSIFSDGESGILSHNGPPGSVRIDHSTFTGLGEGDGVHSIYIGQYGSLTVTNCRFERGRGGHYVKSRAPRIEVLASSFVDSGGRRTNYLIDLSNGAVGRIAGNVFVHGTGKENYTTLISIAPEGAENRSAGLVIEDNVASVAPGFRWSTAFVGDWSGERLEIRNNRLGPKIVSFARR